MDEEQITNAKYKIELLLMNNDGHNKFDCGLRRGLYLACRALGWTIVYPPDGGLEIVIPRATK